METYRFKTNCVGSYDDVWKAAFNRAADWGEVLDGYAVKLANRVVEVMKSNRKGLLLGLPAIHDQVDTFGAMRLRERVIEYGEKEGFERKEINEVYEHLMTLPLHDRPMLSYELHSMLSDADTGLSLSERYPPSDQPDYLDEKITITRRELSQLMTNSPNECGGL